MEKVTYTCSLCAFGLRGSYRATSSQETVIVSFFDSTPGIARVAWQMDQGKDYSPCTKSAFDFAKSETLAAMGLVCQDSQFQAQIAEYEAANEFLPY